MNSCGALMGLLCTVGPLGACVADLGPPKSLASAVDDGGPPDGGGDGDGGAPFAEGGSSVTSVLLVGVGPNSACAVVDEGSSTDSNVRVRCWGSNANGQVGVTSSTTFSATPVTVSSPRVLVPASAPTDGDLALAASYSCAVNSNHYLSCWGKVTPNVPQALAEIQAASVADNGGCLVYGIPAALKCWGAFTPTAGTGVVAQDGGGATDSAFQSVVVGSAHACGIRNGDVYCWGANDHGQVGTASTTRVGTPTALGFSGPALKLATGTNSTCAIVALDTIQENAESGDVFCWGANEHGQLGIDTNGQDPGTPNLVRLGSPATAVAVGDTHACAVLQDATVWCWGDNSSQQLGVGPASPVLMSSVQPRSVKRLNHAGTPIDLGNVKLIAAGGQTTCAVDTNFQMLWCWGANDVGQAGQPQAGVPVSERVVSYATPVVW